jgi:hypothetical protein
MNKDTKEQINSILVAYLGALGDGVADLDAAYQSSPQDYFNAIQRNKALAEAANTAVNTLHEMLAIRETLIK